jgi:hypothetical protein
MTTGRDSFKPTAQGERFIALARKAQVTSPDEVFERKFSELSVIRPPAHRPRKQPVRQLRGSTRQS